MRLYTKLMFVIYLIVYIYSCHKTIVEPNKNYWGYICALVFGILFIWTISLVVKNQKKNTENDTENL